MTPQYCKDCTECQDRRIPGMSIPPKCKATPVTNWVTGVDGLELCVKVRTGPECGGYKEREE